MSKHDVSGEKRDAMGRWTATEEAHKATGKANEASDTMMGGVAADESSRAKMHSGRGNSSGAAGAHNRAASGHANAAEVLRRQNASGSAELHEVARRAHESARNLHNEPHTLESALEASRRADIYYGGITGKPHYSHGLSQDAIIDDQRESHEGAAAAHEEYADELRADKLPTGSINAPTKHAAERHEEVARLHREEAKNLKLSLNDDLRQAALDEFNKWLDEYIEDFKAKIRQQVRRPFGGTRPLEEEV